MTTTPICYKRNFLREVVARVDFISPIEELSNHLPPEISKAAKQHFPIAEPIEMVTSEIKVVPSSENVEHKIARFNQWNFHGKNREKTLSIIPSAFFVRYTKFKNFDSLRDEFMSVFEAFYERYKDLQSKRVGLRFINDFAGDDFTNEEPNPFNWHQYIKTEMISCLLYPSEEDRDKVSRALQTIEFSFENLSMRIVYGLFNPDYPSPIRKKTYILDLDAYSHVVYEAGDIHRLLDDLHTIIQKYFEHSITPEMRALLNR